MTLQFPELITYNECNSCSLDAANLHANQGKTKMQRIMTNSQLITRGGSKGGRQFPIN